MTRGDALKLLRSHVAITFDQVDDIFGAFGFRSVTPAFDTEVYYHPRFKCGKFAARDDGLHELTDEQKGVVLAMVNCVMFDEAYTP